MALTLNPQNMKKRYKIVFSQDNNFCSMPSYLYNSSSNKLESFSAEINFREKDKKKSALSYMAQLQIEKETGLQNNIDILSVQQQQTIYPREENTFLENTFKRANYFFPWKDTLSERQNKVSSSQLDFITTTLQTTAPRTLFSYWPMDSYGSSSLIFSEPITQGELMLKYDYNTINNPVYSILHARFGRSLIYSNTPDNSVQTQAGKGPFPNSYEDFANDIKVIYKDYSILPEYTISDKVSNSITSGISLYDDSFNYFSLRGTSSYSSNNLFLENYVNSDYIDSSESNLQFPNFGLKNIKISINGVKKLLPYEGFYPQQRALQLSTLFSQSIAPTTNLFGSMGTFRTATNNIFSRGLFNSIRAGIACDMPIWQSGSGRSATALSFDRIPFDALYDPSTYIKRGYRIVDKEPIEDRQALTTIIDSTASFGQSNSVYDFAMNNFLSEVPNFFIANSKLSSLSSKPQKDWKFDFGKYTNFSMNVVLEKDADFTNHDSTNYYGYPHNYFVPPYFVLSGSDSTNYWDPASYSDSLIPPTASWKSNRAVATINFDAYTWSQSLTSLNQITTPSINDILSYSTVSYTNENLQEFYPAAIVSGTFMPLSSSVELFGYSFANDVWNVHTKWECPVHNFVGVTTYNSASQSGGDGTTPGDANRGIWHQYSTNAKSGLNLYLEYTSSSSRNIATGSLIEACGFESQPVRVGNLADTKEVFEYVVVIPYYVDECEIETYFKIPLEDFETQYLSVNDSSSDNTIKDLIKKARKCILPPKLDFISYRDSYNRQITDESEYTNTLPPFAMYIYEFSSRLSRQDLSNIWQGVMPSLTERSEFQNISIQHEIRKEEVLNPTNLAEHDKKLPRDIRFKIFKAKARSLSYYRQIKQKTLNEEITNLKNAPSYNWPYDFFSLIEMAKVDIQTTFEKESSE